MKMIFLFLTLTASLLAQEAVTLSETSVNSITSVFSTDAIYSIRQEAKATVVPVPGVIGGLQTTFAANAASGDLTITVASATGITAGMGVYFPDGDETATVASVSGSVLTLVRATLGSTAGTYTTGQTITVLQYGTIADWMKLKAIREIQLTMSQYVPPYISIRQLAIIADQTGAIN